MQILLGLLRAGDIVEWQGLENYNQYDCVYDENRAVIYVSKTDNNKGNLLEDENNWLVLPDLFDGETITI